VPADMKDTIAQAAKSLLMEKGVRKLTVKDIVEECSITRQAFYYHFEDIPALFRWMFERDTERNLLEARAQESGEARLHRFFVVAINAMPYVKKGMESNYREELERLLVEYIQRLFEQVCDEEGLYQDCTRIEVKLILRYHSQAIIGILRSWTEADTKNLDQIVSVVYRLMTEGISPLGGN
jgi:AcrR family transcriptional regulator